jgi:coiled-coil and C2 domain-containing protein 2A
MSLFCIHVVSAEQKTPSGEAPRYAEDEGLYVGERPKVNWTNQVVVENRLLKRRDKVRERGREREIIKM